MRGDSDMARAERRSERRAARKAKQRETRRRRNRARLERGGFSIPPELQEKALAGPVEDKMLRSGENKADAPPDIVFASSAAADLAHGEGLVADDFLGVDPSSTYGYTKADVEAAIRQVRG